MSRMKRTILNEILSRKPDKPLYHYTTQRGLLGIVQTKELWATHTQYLNDSRELGHAVDMVAEEIRTLILTCTDSDRRAILEEMQKGVEFAGGFNVCVSSFSEVRDSLSQWRAYSGTSGFAIGISADHLAKAAASQQCSLAACIYNAAQQQAVIQALVAEIIEENTESHKHADEHGRFLLSLGGNLRAYLNRYGPILKHPSFFEEREWRVISQPLSCREPHFGFREGRSMLIPYFRFNLANEDLPFQIHEVVVGPTAIPGQSADSVRSFLVGQDLATVPVDSSKVPYRTW